MGILDSIVEWIATQVMNLLDLITGSVLGALGCDMSTFLRYFPAAETLYEIFVAIGVGFILLNLVWQLFRNFGLGLGLSAEDPVKLAIKSILFIFLAFFADQIMVLVLGIVGTPYDWVVDTALPPIEFASFASVVTVLVGSLVSGSVSLIVLILVLIVAWNYIKLLFEAAERYILVGVLIYTAPVAFATGASENTSNVFSALSSTKLVSALDPVGRFGSSETDNRIEAEHEQTERRTGYLLYPAKLSCKWALIWRNDSSTQCD